jgi:Fur family zinc uptake transcriptional regulator
LTFDYCPMHFISTIPGNYQILNHRFEVFGTCPDCSENYQEQIPTDNISL